MNIGDYVIISLLFAVSILAFAGNGLVIAAIWYEKKLQKRSNIFIVNLAIADITVSFFNIPLNIASIFSQDWRSSNHMCDVSGFFEMLFLVVSVQTLGQIALNRYFYVVCWKIYDKVMTTVRVLCIVGFLWGLSVLLCLPPLFGWSKYGYKKQMAHCFVFWQIDFSYSVFMNMTCFFAPLFLMAWCYIKIFRMNKAREKEKRRWLRHEVGGRNAIVDSCFNDVIQSSLNVCSSTVSIRDINYVESNDVCKSDTKPDLKGETRSCQTSNVQEVSRKRSQSFTESSLRRHHRVGHQRSHSFVAERTSKKALVQPLPNTPNQHRQFDKMDSLSPLHDLSTTGYSSISTLSVSYQNVSRNHRKSVVERFLSLSGSVYSTSCGNPRRRASIPQISKHENRVTKMMLLMVIVFVLSWSPFVIFMFLENFSVEVPQTLAQFVLVVGYSNSLYNPIIYGVMNSRFHRVYRRIFRKIGCGCI